MACKVEIKTLEKLEKMHTGSLMSRRKALLKCDDSFELSGKAAHSSSGLIEFKDTPEWKQAYKQLKEVLATRENVPNKQERKKLRQLKAKKSK